MSWPLRKKLFSSCLVSTCPLHYWLCTWGPELKIVGLIWTADLAPPGVEVHNVKISKYQSRVSQLSESVDLSRQRLSTLSTQAGTEKSRVDGLAADLAASSPSSAKVGTWVGSASPNSARK